MKTAQPKIQRMVEEESEDTEAVVKLLELNDIINTTLERYNLTRRGDFDAAAVITLQAASSARPAETSTVRQEVSLIDFEESNGAPPSTSARTMKPEDDLLGLSFGDPGPTDDVFGEGGHIALGFGANISTNPIAVNGHSLFNANYCSRHSGATIALLHNGSKHCSATEGNTYSIPQPFNRPFFVNSPSKSLCRSKQPQYSSSLNATAIHSTEAKWE